MAEQSFITGFWFEVWPLTNGPVSVQVLPGSCADDIGSPNDASDEFTVVFDTSAPAVILNVSSLSASSVEVLVRFSEPVFVPSDGSTGPASEAERLDIGVAQLTASGCIVTGLMPLSDELTYVATVIQEGTSKQGAICVSGSAVVDLAGNPNEASPVLTVAFGKETNRLASLKNDDVPPFRRKLISRTRFRPAAA